jgi:hypothetical protein
MAGYEPLFLWNQGYPIEKYLIVTNFDDLKSFGSHYKVHLTFWILKRCFADAIMTVRILRFHPSLGRP